MWAGLGRGHSRPEACSLFFSFSFFLSLGTNPRLHFTASVLHGEGRGRRGAGRDEEGDDCAAPAALLVSSMAADTCSASSAPPTPIHPGAHPGLCVAQFPVSAGTRGSPMMFML